MNNHNLLIYEFDELYKILVEIKKDINLSFEKANKQKLPDLNSESNYLIFTKSPWFCIEIGDYWTYWVFHYFAVVATHPAIHFHRFYRVYMNLVAFV